MSFDLDKILKYLTLFVMSFTGLAIICSGIVYVVRSTAEYTSYLKELEKNIGLNKMGLDNHDTRINELERYKQLGEAKIPQNLKENTDLSAFAKISVINKLSNDQFKQAIKDVEESTNLHQAGTRLQESGLFAKADLREIFATTIVKPENSKKNPSKASLGLPNERDQGKVSDLNQE